MNEIAYYALLGAIAVAFLLMVSYSIQAIFPWPAPLKADAEPTQVVKATEEPTGLSDTLLQYMAWCRMSSKIEPNSQEMVDGVRWFFRLYDAWVGVLGRPVKFRFSSAVVMYEVVSSGQLLDALVAASCGKTEVHHSLGDTNNIRWGVWLGEAWEDSAPMNPLLVFLQHVVNETKALCRHDPHYYSRDLEVSLAADGNDLEEARFSLTPEGLARFRDDVIRIRQNWDGPTMDFGVFMLHEVA